MSRSIKSNALSRQRLIFTGTGFPGKDGADWMMHWVGKLSENGMQNAYFRISKEERRVHHFVVKKMATANEPITAELVGVELGLPVNRVEKTIDKLEGLKTFLYRSDGKGINWAYPYSLDNTGHKMTASTGEQFFAA